MRDETKLRQEKEAEWNVCEPSPSSALNEEEVSDMPPVVRAALGIKLEESAVACTDGGDGVEGPEGGGSPSLANLNDAMLALGEIRGDGGVLSSATSPGGGVGDDVDPWSLLGGGSAGAGGGVGVDMKVVGGVDGGGNGAGARAGELGEGKEEVMHGGSAESGGNVDDGGSRRIIEGEGGGGIRGTGGETKSGNANDDGGVEEKKKGLVSQAMGGDVPTTTPVASRVTRSQRKGDCPAGGVPSNGAGGALSVATRGQPIDATAESSGVVVRGAMSSAEQEISDSGTDSEGEEGGGKPSGNGQDTRRKTGETRAPAENTEADDMEVDCGEEEVVKGATEVAGEEEQAVPLMSTMTVNKQEESSSATPNGAGDNANINMTSENGDAKNSAVDVTGAEVTTNRKADREESPGQDGTVPGTVPSAAGAAVEPSSVAAEVVSVGEKPSPAPHANGNLPSGSEAEIKGAPTMEKEERSAKEATTTSCTPSEDNSPPPRTVVSNGQRSAAASSSSSPTKLLEPTADGLTVTPAVTRDFEEMTDVKDNGVCNAPGGQSVGEQQPIVGSQLESVVVVGGEGDESEWTGMIMEEGPLFTLPVGDGAQDVENP